MVFRLGKPRRQEPSARGQSLQSVFRPRPRRTHSVEEGEEHERGGGQSRVSEPGFGGQRGLARGSSQ
eukprot:805959-Alexandrium_andersonii.AAC.1